ncbi:hypothetical protein [Paenibacillus agricola]|nr:hypothetical protein [Paenibacillus agricola]
MQNQRNGKRKQKDWRRAIVNLMLGLLAAIVLWIIVLWATLQTE